MAESSLAAADPTQVSLMEECIIVVDEDDNALRPGSKKECHLVANMYAKSTGGGAADLLHRAFSVFLFDSKGRLLLQRRSAEKITFPLYWANTCCSHPLHTEGEMELENALGVKRAAQRKLLHELGITPDQVPLEDFTFLTRIHYRSKDPTHGDDTPWGEHEIDHVLVIQTKEGRDVVLKPDPNEVSETRYFTQEELGAFLAGAQEQGVRVSSWFYFIAKELLPAWWANLGSLASLQDTKIHRAGEQNGITSS